LSNSVVYIRECPRYEDAAAVVHELLCRSGIRFAGKKVLVKPNILSGKPPETATTTHPAIVEAVVDFLIGAGAEVSVGDNPGMSGYGSSIGAAKYSGILDASRGRYINISLQSRGVPVRSRFFDMLNCSSAVLDADLVVNLPKLKTHTLTVFTGAVKNMFGILVGGEKARTHALAGTPENFGEALVDIFSVRPPELSIMDAVLGMDGNGPNAGRPRHVGLIGMSGDAVALDATFARVVGIDPFRIPHLRHASERGCGRMASEEIDVDGTIPHIRRFAIPLSRRVKFLGDFSISAIHRLVFPFLTEGAKLKLVRKTCTRCGACVRGCPTGAMRTDADGYPCIDKPKCITCYCCHELCVETAWKMTGLMNIISWRQR